jgi:hypothetical protein
MTKQDYLKRMGQIFALHVQKGYSIDELMKYTEQAFSYLYLSDNSKQKDRLGNK